jgi:mannose-6-phosphate isomerase-like protein (cupin superfamily)
MNLSPLALDPVARSTRPWGVFDLFVANHHCTVKIITIRPGHRMSLQRHLRRDEAWHVIDGRLNVLHGTKEWTAETGDAVWIPRGTAYRMGNSGPTPTRVLEIASGALDEDDIEVLDDDNRHHSTGTT